MTFKPLPILTAFTAVSLAILIWLGNWQWERYSQKIARADAGPVDWDRTKISSEFDAPFRVRTVMFGNPVWKIILPIQIDSGGVRYAVVELVESEDPPALKEIEDYPIVGQSVEGIYTSPKGPGAFTISSDPQARTWYAFDAEELSATFGYPPAAERPLFEPVELKYIDASGMARLVRNPYADFYQGDTLPPQRHFGYAITWWGLAIALFVIYAVFHHSQGRLRFRKIV